MKTTLLALTGLLLPLSLQAQFSQPVRDVENPAQNVFVASGNGNTNTTSNLIINVRPLPAGKRLAIEGLSLRCRLSKDSGIYDAHVSAWHKIPSEQFAQQRRFRIFMQKQGELGNNAFWVGSLNGKVFSDYIAPNFDIEIEVWRDSVASNTPAFACEYALNGGLTNLPLQ